MDDIRLSENFRGRVMSARVLQMRGEDGRPRRSRTLIANGECNRATTGRWKLKSNRIGFLSNR